MRTRTTSLFRLRRLAAYTRRSIPGIKKEGRRRIAAGWSLFNGERMERELFNSCIVLKNLAMVHQDMPMSGDFILEQLMECSKSLKNVYADILSAYRLGQGENAFLLLPARVPTKAAANFAAILSKVDKINPAELRLHMASFEETLTGERMTKGMSRTEKKSLITTMAATATIFAMLLNFTIVVVFMDALKMVEQIF